MAHPLRPRRGARRAPAALDMLARGRFAGLADMAGTDMAGTTAPSERPPRPQTSPTQTPRARTAEPPLVEAGPALDVELLWTPPGEETAPPRRESLHLPISEGVAASVCLIARGTPVETASGPCAVEDLRPGMALVTVDHGPRPLRWIACSRPGALPPARAMRFLRIRAEAFGPARPPHDIVVGAGFRLVPGDAMSRALAGVPGALVPAEALSDGMGVIEMGAGPDLDFYALGCDTHEILRTGRLLTESYHPGLDRIAVMEEASRAALARLMPHLEGELYRLGPLSRPRLNAAAG